MQTGRFCSSLLGFHASTRVQSLSQRLVLMRYASTNSDWFDDTQSTENATEATYTASKTLPVIKPLVDTSKPVLGRTVAEQEFLYLQQPDMPENPKTLKISILGVPNSGKSTLLNRLMNRRISAVSRKMNTTRNRLTGIITDHDTQLLVLDTPGLVAFNKKKKLNMDRSMLVDPHSGLWESDLACVVHDCSDEFMSNRLDREIIKCLFAHPEKETVLVLNKIDRLKNKSALLQMIADLTGGHLNGKEFLSREKDALKRKILRNRLNDTDYLLMFDRTEKKLLELRSNMSLSKHYMRRFGEKSQEVDKLLDELRKCEEHLLKHLDQIDVTQGRDEDFDNENDENDVGFVLSEKSRITLAKLRGDDDDDAESAPKVSLALDNNPQLSLINSIAKESPATPASQRPRRLEDISPLEFKRDLLKTTDWHLYYKKLSSLATLVREKNYWPYFNQVFMISSRTGEGVDELKRYLFARARPGPWQFTRSLVTDQMPHVIAEQCVREKLLEHVPNEVGYQVMLQTSVWELDENDCLNIAINIIPGVNKTSFKRQISVLFSQNGHYLRIIKQEVLQELMNTFQCEIRLRIIVLK